LKKPTQELKHSDTQELPKDTRLIREITLKNILSFGPEGMTLPLKSLNVLIGPNGSGKSNLIDCIGLMRSTPLNINNAIRDDENSIEWKWKDNLLNSMSIELVFTSLSHRIELDGDKEGFIIMKEFVGRKKGDKSPDYYLWDGHRSRAILYGNDAQLHSGNRFKSFNLDTFRRNQSILTQRQEPELYPYFSKLISTYSEIGLYREWIIGNNCIFRKPQSAGIPAGRMDEKFTNSHLFINKLWSKSSTKGRILDALSDLNEAIVDLGFYINGNLMSLYLVERSKTIPATRLSDGTLRYLCLLAILCDPEPPPLICIEEPELGLHPDVLPGLADLLVEASTRTQLIVTTHSEILVDALNDTPESVVVCEKHNGATVMERLNPDHLKPYLEKYRLGELWLSGDLGGKRW
jgi:predicted ATPase